MLDTNFCTYIMVPDYGYRCTVYFLSNSRCIKGASERGPTREKGMDMAASTGTCNSYGSVGNTALEAARPHLRLVYDRDALGCEYGVSNRRHDAFAALVPFDAKCLFSMLAVVAIVLCCSFAFEGVRSMKIHQVLESARVEEVRAVTGDTLWSIAEQCGGNDVPTEDVVSWIRSRNKLSSAILTPGQRISVPVVTL